MLARSSVIRKLACAGERKRGNRKSAKIIGWVELALSHSIKCYHVMFGYRISSFNMREDCIEHRARRVVYSSVISVIILV